MRISTDELETAKAAPQAPSQTRTVTMDTTAKPGGKLTRLEIMLAAWEDRMWVSEMFGKRIKALGIHRRWQTDYFAGGDLNNWRSFRKYLLNAVASRADVPGFDLERYGHEINLIHASAVDALDFDPLLMA